MLRFGVQSEVVFVLDSACSKLQLIGEWRRFTRAARVRTGVMNRAEQGLRAVATPRPLEVVVLRRLEVRADVDDTFEDQTAAQRGELCGVRTWLV